MEERDPPEAQHLAGIADCSVRGRSELVKAASALSSPQSTVLSPTLPSCHASQPPAPSFPPVSHASQFQDPDAHAPSGAPTQLSTFHFPPFFLLSSHSTAAIGQRASSLRPINAALSPPCYWVEQNKNKQSERGLRRSEAAAEAEQRVSAGGPGTWASSGDGGGPRGQYQRGGSHTQNDCTLSLSPRLSSEAAARWEGEGARDRDRLGSGPARVGGGPASSSEPRRRAAAAQRPGMRRAGSGSLPGRGPERGGAGPPPPGPSRGRAECAGRSPARGCSSSAPRPSSHFYLEGGRWEARFWRD